MQLFRIGKVLVAGITALCFLAPLKAQNTPQLPTIAFSAGWNLVSGNVAYFMNSNGPFYTIADDGSGYIAVGRDQLEVFNGYWLYLDEFQQIPAYDPNLGRAGQAEIGTESETLCSDTQGPQPCFETCTLPPIRCAIGAAPYKIPVKKGWTMIANGFGEPVAVTDLSVTVYTYNPTIRQYGKTDMLQSHQGALIWAEQDATVEESAIP